jgi:methyl-accepting chemotaxis protein
MRAAEAAKNAATLLEDTVKRITSGEALTPSTGEIFFAVQDKVKTLSTLIAEATQAANEHASGIEQINEAVSNINTVVQGNVASAQKLLATVEVFNGGNGSHGSHPPMLPEST